MKITYYIIVISICVLSIACGGDDSRSNTQVKTEKENEVKIIRSKTFVNPSPDTDYPSIYRKLKISMMPKTEVVNAGSDIDTLSQDFMLQLITENTVEEVIDFYKKDLTAKGWTEGKINVYSGAQKAILMETPEAVFKAIIIDDEDHRKVAIMLNKPVDLSKFQ